MRLKKRPEELSAAQKAQLELSIQRELENDRNYSLGGRSFYFFDFDDNIVNLSTSTYIFHKETGEEIRLSSKEFAEISRKVGVSGPYRDYEIRFDDETGSFRHFRDRKLGPLSKLLGKKQAFIQDLVVAMSRPDFIWKGPSWDCFYHAVYNQRPISLITARGHHPETIKHGIEQMIRHGHLPHQPNYLSIYPINYPPVREELSLGEKKSVAEMKRAAIRASVAKAIEVYGYSPYHRFGMSDDDDANLELIMEEMKYLKSVYPQMSFFVFDTQSGHIIKREVFHDHIENKKLDSPAQMSLF
jgi:hypothetical protein